MLAVNGYVFSNSYVNTSKKRSYWYCDQRIERTCRASLVIEGSKDFIALGEHNHAPMTSHPQAAATNGGHELAGKLQPDIQVKPCKLLQGRIVAHPETGGK